MQYREVQQKESRQFKSLFPVLIYLDGGVASGFTRVKAFIYRPRLLWIKGRKRVVVREVPITHASLNEGDSFIFDGGKSLLIWNGRKTNMMEKHKVI